MAKEPSARFLEIKARVHNSSWYKRGKNARIQALNNGIVPLTDDECSKDSLYLWRKNGELWTFTTDKSKIVPYKMVRPATKERPEDAVICMHCRTVFETLTEAEAHYAEDNSSV